MSLWSRCEHRGSRIFMWASLKSWLVMISGTSLTPSVQRLTCYCGLLPTSNKLSSFLHLSRGSLVSCVWQAACLQVRFQPREGRASSRGKLSSFCQTTGKRRSLSLPLFLCLPLSPSIYLSLCIILVPWCRSSHSQCLLYASLSLAVQNKQAGVRGWNAKCPQGARPGVALTPSLLPPEGHSSHPSMLAESDIKTASWTEVKDARCVLP